MIKINASIVSDDDKLRILFAIDKDGFKIYPELTLSKEGETMRGIQQEFKRFLAEINNRF